VTNLAGDSADPELVQEQAGHRLAKITVICAAVCGGFMNTMMRRHRALQLGERRG
jgi:hypothetical protein